ncbi:MAG: porphobilinogen synthase [bacterium]
MNFSQSRLRRIRSSENIRRLVRETYLSISDLIYPLFVVHGSNIKEEIRSMPGNFRFSVDRLVEETKEIESMGIPAILLFGIPKKKDSLASESYAEDGIIQQAIRAIKREGVNLLIITDVCLCEYTDHGHCGVVEAGNVLNDPTLELLAKQALSYVMAGADMVAPSDMMDGRVGRIRRFLDEYRFVDVPIMSYAAKYASGFYGPFREAAESTPQFGDRRTYQMDPGNSNEALREVILDINEGADIIMVKPALPYLDIIYRVKTELRMPTAAYNVSGEFSMIKAAGERGWIDEKRVMMETLLSIKRAGADMIITYFAKEVAREIK